MMPMQPPPDAMQNPAQGADPKQVEATIVKVIQQLQKTASENGLDFEMILGKVLGGGAKAPSAPLPPPM